MSEKRIKQMLAPSGDWFRLTIEHLEGEKKRIVMSRVCGWAVLTYDPPAPDKIRDWVEGADSNGYGHVDDNMDHAYVHGDDLAPNGKSWRAVFNETPSFNWGLKEISELASKIDSQAKLVLSPLTKNRKKPSRH